MRTSKRARRDGSTLGLRLWEFTGTAMVNLFIFMLVVAYFSPLTYMLVTSLKTQAQLQDTRAGPVSFLVNAPSSEVYGLEVETTLRPTDGFRVNASLGWLHSKYKELTLQGADLSGNELPFAPKLTAQLGFDCLAKGGKLVMVGLFGGGAPWALPLIAMKAITIQGSYVGSLNETQELIDLVREKKIPPIPVTPRALSDVNASLKDLLQGKLVGGNGGHGRSPRSCQGRQVNWRAPSRRSG